MFTNTIKMKYLQASCTIILAASSGACASYNITPTTLDKLQESSVNGVPYFLPALNIEATAKWTIIACANANDITLQTEISETEKYIADENELYVLDTQKAAGGLLDTNLSLTLNDQGILTGFDSKTDGKAADVTKELGQLTASFSGVPSFASGLSAGDIDTKVTDDICSVKVNGRSLAEWGELRNKYTEQLKNVDVIDNASENVKLDEIAKKWITPKTANDRRNYLTAQLRNIDEQTSFSATVSFDPVSNNTPALKIPFKDIAWASGGSATAAQIEKIADQSQVTIRNNLENTLSKTTSIENTRNSLIYRVPALIELTYSSRRVRETGNGNIENYEEQKSKHLAPQAGAYASIPIKSDAFGSVQTKVTFGSNGMVSTYGFESKTGLASGVGAVNEFSSTIAGAETAAIVAETERIRAVLALQEQQRLLSQSSANTANIAGSP